MAVQHRHGFQGDASLPRQHDQSGSGPDSAPPRFPCAPGSNTVARLVPASGLAYVLALSASAVLSSSPLSPCLTLKHMLAPSHHLSLSLSVQQPLTTTPQSANRKWPSADECQTTHLFLYPFPFSVSLSISLFLMFLLWYYLKGIFLWQFHFILHAPF